MENENYGDITNANEFFNQRSKQKKFARNAFVEL